MKKMKALLYEVASPLNSFSQAGKAENRMSREYSFGIFRKLIEHKLLHCECIAMF